MPKTYAGNQPAACLMEHAEGCGSRLKPCGLIPTTLGMSPTIKPLDNVAAIDWPSPSFLTQLPMMKAHGIPDGPLSFPHATQYPVHALAQDKKHITQVSSIPFSSDTKQQPPTIAKPNVSSLSLLCNSTDFPPLYFATFVYASNDRKDREALWKELQSNHAMVDNSSPWMITGDFNVVRNDNERKGGKGIDKIAVSDFNRCLEAIEVTDLRYSGCLHTFFFFGTRNSPG